MTNLIPAVTFVMATIVGLEKVNTRSLRGIAKIIGTVLCVGGAVCMAFLKGPRLLNSQLLPAKSLLLGMGGGGLSSFICVLLLLVILDDYAGPYISKQSGPLVFKMCFLTTIQSAIFTFFVETDLEVWRLDSLLEIGSCMYAGIGTSLSYFVQAWCITQRGPLFVALFSRLCTVITTIIASLFLDEKLYTGSLLGAFGVIFGLYVVLWGKAKDLEDRNSIKVLIDQSEKISSSYKADLEESLLHDFVLFIFFLMHPHVQEWRN